MRFVKNVLLSVFAFGGGLTVAGGVFTVLLAIGLLPRFAEKTHTAKYIFWYEEMVVAGTIVGSFLSVYQRYGMLGNFMLGHVGVEVTLWHNIGRVLLAVSGVFDGIFVGCLALAIAEMLDTIPIFSRRIHLQKGLGVVICFVAIGKMLGSMIYYAYALYISG